jgi:hypothetical protein
VGEQNSRPVFSGIRHGGAEKKFNRTGGTAGKNPCGWLGSARDGDGKFDTAASDSAPRAEGEATKPAARIAGFRLP